MSLINVSKEMFNNGVFTFANGDYIFIEEIMYSGDGLYWEDDFNPNSHVDPRDPTNTLPGHKYRRVRHAGDAYFQTAEYIVAEDGKTPMFRIYNEELQYKYEDEADTAYQTLTSMDNLKGDIGAKGDTGTGWQVDIVSYWNEKPDCTDTIGQTSSSCATCSTGTVSSSSCTGNPILMLSLGDGKYEIDVPDVGNFYSTDGSTWIEILSSDVGRLVRYTATDAFGTGSVDYRTQDTLSTRGKVYYCVDGVWTLFLNVAVQDHKLSPTSAYFIASQNGFYMEDYVAAPLNTNPVYNTLALTTDFKLVVRQDSLEPIHFKDGSFGDGFDEGTVNADGIKAGTIKANVADYDGFGLKTYVSNADSLTDLQVDIDVLIGDGLLNYDDNTNNVDGEDRRLIAINPVDFIPALSGLEVFAGVDTNPDIRVDAGKGIALDANGTNADVDDLAIAFDGSDKITIKPYVAGNDGVLALHLNPALANTAKALAVNNSTGLEVVLQPANSGLAFDGVSGGLTLGSHAVEGIHLHDNIADTNKGIEMDTTTNMLEVLLQAAGGLRFNASGGIEVDPTNLAWLTSAVVSKIEVNGSDYQGDLVLENAAAGTDTYMDLAVTAAGQTITITPNTNLANLTSLINSLIASAGTGAHTHVIADITDWPSDLVQNATTYGNIRLASNGLFIRNASNNAWAKIVSVDDDFNLGTDDTVAPI
jgi:hypothetical protein